MQKISLKLNKDSLKDYKTSSYTNKNGEIVEQYDLELVMKPVTEIKADTAEVIKTGETWELVNLGFVAGKSIKGEDGQYSKEPIFGNATHIRNKAVKEKESEDVSTGGYTGEVNADDIHF